MIHLIRELGKIFMFATIWAFPIVLSRWNGNNRFLWFFIVSFIVTMGIFSHYEDLEKIDNVNSYKDESDE